MNIEVLSYIVLQNRSGLRLHLNRENARRLFILKNVEAENLAKLKVSRFSL